MADPSDSNMTWSTLSGRSQGDASRGGSEGGQTVRRHRKRTHTADHAVTMYADHAGPSQSEAATAACTLLMCVTVTHLPLAAKHPSPSAPALHSARPALSPYLSPYLLLVTPTCVMVQRGLPGSSSTLMNMGKLTKK